MSCNNTNETGIYFFKGVNQNSIKNSLCSLTNSELVASFLLISTEIDFSEVKQLVTFQRKFSINKCINMKNKNYKGLSNNI
jgi:hypothetical protein